MIEALLLGLVAFIAQSEYALGTSLISRPIVTGLLTGLVLGDMETGIVMGATLELAFIGSFSVGASLPPDVVTGGILGVAFAINSGAGAETALLLGLPIATLALIVKISITECLFRCSVIKPMLTLRWGIPGALSVCI